MGSGTGGTSSDREGVPAPRHVRGVGAIIFDEAGRLLVVQRGHEPAKGLWSVPGGKVELGETDEQAVEREVFEETGLRVTVGALAGSVTRPGVPGTIYEISDYDATLADGSVPGEFPAPGHDPGHAADDAADLRWVTRAELEALPLTDGLIDALKSWGRLA